MADKDQRLTIDNSTHASHPGNIKVSMLRWAMFYPKWPVVLVGSVLLSIALVFLVHRRFSVLVLLLLGACRHYWIRVKEHFQHGDTNPAIVLSMHPTLIAVYTDLTKGIGEYPVIRVVRVRLPKIAGKLPVIGDHLAVVSLYERSDTDQEPYWQNFNPRPVDCATKNIAEIQHLMSRLEPEQWHKLQQGVDQLRRPIGPGLYRVGGDWH